ncbi:MAG: GDP-mannose 4,6-dehydratase [Candidatus Methanoperedens sp.]|nr:GDP-mannose 4,6-dehydratase [Candidatus Methanoperedens sp.]
MNSNTTGKNSYQMNNKKIIITGINGFIGRNFLQVLLEKSPDAHVYGIDRVFNNSEKFTPVECDLNKKEKVKSILSEISPDYIFHFAGTAYNNDWDALFSANVKSTVNLLESARELAFNPRFIIIGSAAEYGIAEKMPVDETAAPNPTSPYGASMSCRTNIAMAFRNMGSDVMVGRVFNTTGAGVTDRTPVGSFARQVAAIEKGLNEPVHAGNLSPQRDFIDIEDVSNAFYFLALKSKKGGIYNICSGKPHSIATILDTYKELSCRKFSIITDPALIRQNDTAAMYGDNRKIRAETGWKPEIGLHESLKRTLDFYRKV